MQLDRYVTGGVHWAGYPLDTLIVMVVEHADPAQLDALADEWTQRARSLTRLAEDLRHSLATLTGYWSGSAADRAVLAVDDAVTRIDELAATAGRMAGPVQDAGGALHSARTTMPGVTALDLLVTASAAAAAGLVTGGGLGAALGAAIGGLTSAFDTDAERKAAKRQAVQTMHRYEQALIAVDSATPAFTPPTATHRDATPATPTTSTVPDPAPAPAAPRPGASTGPASAATAVSRWQALTGAAPETSGTPTPDPARTPARPRSVHLRPRPPVPAPRHPTRDPTGRDWAGYPGALGTPAADPRTGEHRRRFPLDDDLFSTDQRAAPPVIGL